ncbi:MAG: tryptophan synthase alpha chain [Gammaproteobacteria bacterium]|jgi:tryptophan synthase alpha chain
MPLTIKACVKALQQKNKKALVAYLTAGDPHLQFTHDLILELENTGVDILELGVPFNYPVGDGPIIQRSARRALESGTSLSVILPFVARLRQDGVEMPIVLFSYHNPIYAYGYEKLANESAAAGLSAILVVDLPPEESAEYCGYFNGAGLDTIFLATPTTSTDRLELVERASSGFCYYVSRAGVTGGKHDLSDSLAAELSHVKKFISIPVFVGFGIRTADHARTIGKIADGVIVGSAFVESIELASSDAEAKKKIVALASAFRDALDS